MPINIKDADREKLKIILKEEGKWDAYWQKRQEGKAEGLDTEQAHSKAMEHIICNGAVGKKVIPMDGSITGTISKEEQELLKELGGESKNAREIIEWIYNHLGMEEVSPLDAPTPGAYYHLKRIQVDPDLQSEFFKNIWPKILPKADMMDEMMARMSDDGGKTFGVIDQVLAALSTAVKG
jgi:hypothetical protein